MRIVKLIVKNGTNGYDTYQIGKDIPDVRKRIKCSGIEHSPGGYTVVGHSGSVYIDVKEEFVVKRVTLDDKAFEDEET